MIVCSFSIFGNVLGEEFENSNLVYYDSLNDVMVSTNESIVKFNVSNVNYLEDRILIEFNSNLDGFNMTYLISEDYNTQFIRNNILIINISKINLNHIIFLGLEFELEGIRYFYFLNESIDLNLNFLNKSYIKSVNMCELVGLEKLGYYLEINFFGNFYNSNLDTREYVIKADLYSIFDEFITGYSKVHEFNSFENEFIITINGSLIFDSQIEGPYYLKNISVFDLEENLINYYGNSIECEDSSFIEFHNWDLPPLETNNIINQDSNLVGSQIKSNSQSSSGGGSLFSNIHSNLNYNEFEIDYNGVQYDDSNDDYNNSYNLTFENEFTNKYYNKIIVRNQSLNESFDQINNLNDNNSFVNLGLNFENLFNLDYKIILLVIFLVIVGILLFIR